MKRDMDLVRRILFYVEENYVAGQKWLREINIEGYDNDVIMEHVLLAYEDGLLQDIKNVSALDYTAYWIGNLSNAGYDLLDKIRNDTVWNKTKTVIKEKGLPMVTGIISTIANTVISAAVEGATNAILKNGGV